MNTGEKLKKLRSLMRDNQIDTYIITKNDPHISEYSPSHWNSVKFISGFTGSAGTVVITQNEACLWTDGRYFIQAANELTNTEFILQKIGNIDTKDFVTYAGDETPQNGKISFDGRTLPSKFGEDLENKIRHKKISLVTDKDLVGDFWNERPKLSKSKVFDHLVKYCGKSRVEKLKEVREGIKAFEADVYVISSADDIAWLFNLRGNDLPNIPLFASYAVIGREMAVLFVDEEKTMDVKDVLEKDGIILKDYSEIYEYLKSFNVENKFLINPAKTSFQLYNQIKNYEIEKISTDITTNLKSIKNKIELENLEKVNIRDGIAMIRFIMWLKEHKDKEKLSEYEIGLKIDELRKGLENYIHPSFDTIAAYNQNAAIMHYRADKKNCDFIRPEGMILVDSGASFLDGTTDITRTIILGEISGQIKRDFTLVLKSHIALSRVVFLYGATGSNLDVLARMPMWENGIDYKSGTGHGIGFFLNIHEGPQNFSQRVNDVKLEPGMIITIEPGIYREGQYGIRTENTVRVMEHFENEFGRFLKFEVFSYCPIDKTGIDISFLNQDEKNWLNLYNKTIFEKLSPFLNEKEKEWLKEETLEV